MLDRLHTALARERDFVADASHELRTPLALLKTELELALHRPRTPTETDAALRAALADTDRLVTLAEDLLLLARTDHTTASSTEPVALAPLLHEAAHRHQPAANGRPIAVRCPDDLVAHLDPAQLRRAIDNLIDNALGHGAGPIDITARADRGQVVLSVRDHGPASRPTSCPTPSTGSPARTPPAPVPAPAWAWPSWPRSAADTAAPPTPATIPTRAPRSSCNCPQDPPVPDQRPTRSLGARTMRQSGSTTFSDETTTRVNGPRHAHRPSEGPR